MARAVGAAMQIPALRGAARVAGRARCRFVAGRKRGENRVEARDDGGFASDHQAIAPRETRDAPTRPDVDVMDAARFQRVRAAEIVAVIRIAAVDDDVAGIEQRDEQCERLVDDRSGHHQPHDARRGEPRDQVCQRRRPDDARLQRIGDGARVHVVHDARMARASKPAHHRRPHSSQSDHADLHQASLLLLARARRTVTATRWSCRSSTSETTWSRASTPSALTCVPLAPSVICVTVMW